MAETVGEQLKTAREARKLTLEQVYQATRVNVRFLKALEEDRHESLPSAVQAKGFLRLYSDFLGLPTQALVDLWEGNTLPDAPIEVIDDEAERESQEEQAEQVEEIVPIVVALDEDETAAPPAPEAALITPSEQIFQEIGVQLRERRESLGLTLVDVEHYTRLRQHYLSALEDGRMRDLPSLVQGRGMLFNYATFLEMDAESLLLRFAEGLQERRIEIMPPEPAPNLLQRRKPKPAEPVPANSLKRFITPDLLIGAGVILVILIFAIWGAAQVSAMRREQASRTEVPVANVLLFTQTPVPPEATEEGAVPAAITLAPNSEIGNLPANPPAGDSTATQLPVLDDAPLQVYIIAKDRAWMRVLEDGEQAFSGRVTPGNVYPFSADEQIEFVTGNAAGLQVFFNQMDLGSLGLYGQPVSLIFNAEGVITPTPSFTETPTPTQEPSQTPTISETPRATPSITPFIP